MGGEEALPALRRPGQGRPGLIPAAVPVAIRRNAAEAGKRCVPEEVAVALTYNRTTHAVMMATPSDLEDFAAGFSCAEGIVDSHADIQELDVVSVLDGIELRMWIPAPLLARLDNRRRHLAGPTGCGLCGLDSLADAMRAPPAITRCKRWRAADVAAAASSLRGAQALNDRTHGVHAAGYWRDGMLAVREDVGRHNALDKLTGALARGGQAGGDGLLVLTSRVSVELVQKAARAGMATMVAISVPTALAVRTAQAAGITLVAVARDDGFEVFTHPERITAP